MASQAIVGVMNRAPFFSNSLKKFARRYVVLGLALLAVAGVLMLLWPRKAGLKISSLAVQRADDGTWYSTLLLTNELDVHVEFSWLESEDRELGVKHAERALFYDYNSAQSSIGPHDSVTYSRRLPPPGTARRFRLRFQALARNESRLKQLLREIFPTDDSRPRGRLVISPEVSAPTSSTNLSPIL